MSNKRWALLFALVILLCAAVTLLLPSGGSTVGIWQRGELLCTIDLAAVTEPYTLRIPYEGGESIVCVEPGSICIQSADCKSQTCVRHGRLRPGGTPIVCLPERIVIRYLRTEGGVDAVTG